MKSSMCVVSGRNPWNTSSSRGKKTRASWPECYSVPRSPKVSERSTLFQTYCGALLYSHTTTMRSRRVFTLPSAKSVLWYCSSRGRRRRYSLELIGTALHEWREGVDMQYKSTAACRWRQLTIPAIVSGEYVVHGTGNLALDARTYQTTKEPCGGIIPPSLPPGQTQSTLCLSQTIFNFA